ncbi:hypothetical protein CspHIS471_0501440 [Cutaneotrichosporon sp. HIS471]|nr:hypothetical protein CspHIS471_0501440 [Cutaneotrichosporon sp. HIS471]
MRGLYDSILNAALNCDMPAMLAFRDILFDPSPDHPPMLSVFFLEVVLGPHLDLLTRAEMLRPERVVYPLLAARLRTKLIVMARTGDERSQQLLDTYPLQMSPEERVGLSSEDVVQTFKWRVLEVLCRML